MRLLLATRNEHKRRELARLLPGIDVDVLPDHVILPPEHGHTFEENALEKARAAARSTGSCAIADDSGIEAEALSGAPGVRSARYAGESATDAENLAKLLREAPAGSRLRYRCALAFADPHRDLEMIFTGSCTGTLAGEPRGGGGFGYDPAFVPDDQPSGDLGGASGIGEASGALTPGVVMHPEDSPERPEARLRTMAQLSDAEKDAISHRGRAARALLSWLSSEQVDRR